MLLKGPITLKEKDETTRGNITLAETFNNPFSIMEKIKRSGLKQKIKAITTKLEFHTSIMIIK